MEHTRWKSSDLPQELAPSDTLASQFFSTGLSPHSSGRQSVFDRLYNRPPRKSNQQSTPLAIPQSRKPRPKVEDELLRKFEEAKVRKQQLREKWEREVMQEVLPRPRISEKSRQLARRPAPRGGYSRCYAHEQPLCGRQLPRFSYAWKEFKPVERAEHRRRTTDLLSPDGRKSMPVSLVPSCSPSLLATSPCFYVAEPLEISKGE